MHEIRINLDEELYYKVKEEAARKGMNLSESSFFELLFGKIISLGKRDFSKKYLGFLLGISQITSV